MLWTRTDPLPWSRWTCRHRLIWSTVVYFYRGCNTRYTRLVSLNWRSTEFDPTSATVVHMSSGCQLNRRHRYRKLAYHRALPWALLFYSHCMLHLWCRSPRPSVHSTTSMLMTSTFTFPPARMSSPLESGTSKHFVDALYCLTIFIEISRNY